MDVVAHEAELARPTKDGSTARAYIEASANAGNVDMQKKLHGPPFPEPVRYVYDWFLELGASRGEGMHGPAPITHAGIAAWADLTDQAPRPHEVRALIALDVVWRSALLTDAPPEPAASNAPTSAWPTKKGGD